MKIFKTIALLSMSLLLVNSAFAANNESRSHDAKKAAAYSKKHCHYKNKCTKDKKGKKHCKKEKACPK